MLHIIFKNLLRRKIRTSLTILGVSIGVIAIIALGALADGLPERLRWGMTTFVDIEVDG